MIPYCTFYLKGEQVQSSVYLTMVLHSGVLIISNLLIFRAKISDDALDMAGVLVEGGLKADGCIMGIDVSHRCATYSVYTGPSPEEVIDILFRHGDLVFNVDDQDAMGKVSSGVRDATWLRSLLPHHVLLARSLQVPGGRRHRWEGGMNRLLGLFEFGEVTSEAMCYLMDVDCDQILDEMLSCDVEVRYAWDAQTGA